MSIASRQSQINLFDSISFRYGMGYTLENYWLEPEHHLFEKENHLNQTVTIVFQPLLFGGVNLRKFGTKVGFNIKYTWLYYIKERQEDAKNSRLFRSSLVSIAIAPKIPRHITKHFRYLKWRNPHLYKRKGGLGREKPPPK